MADITQMVSDPEFMALSPSDQQAALSQFDPEAGKLNPKDFAGAVMHLQKQGISRPDLMTPPPAATNSQPMVGDGSTVGAVANHVADGLGAFTSSFGAPGSIQEVKQANAQLPGQLAHPVDTAKQVAGGAASGVLNAGAEAYQNGKDSWNSGHPVDAANHMLNFLLSPVGGGLLDKAEMETGNPDETKRNFSKGAGHTLALLAPFLFGGGEDAPATTQAEANARATAANSAYKAPSSSDLIQRGVEGASNMATTAISKGAYNAAKAGTKYIGIPAVKGVASAIGEMATDAAEAGGKNIAGKITDTLNSLGPVGEGIQAKVANMADKIKEGYIPSKQSIELLVEDHYALVDDLIFRNLGAIGGLVKSAAGKAGDALAQQGISADVAQDAIKAATNKVKDEWTYWTNRPPSVSGGSFDADSSFNEALNEQLRSKGITPQANAKNVMDTEAADAATHGDPENLEPTPLTPTGRTPLVDLANREQWAKNLPDGYTSGMKLGGGVEKADLRLRGTPGLGTEYFGKNEVFNDRLTEMYGKASVDGADGAPGGLSSRARDLFKQAADAATASGKANPRAVASQIEDGLRQPGFFQDFKNGQLTNDSTARMKLTQQAMQQADRHMAATSKVQSIPAAASSLGLGSAGAILGTTLAPGIGTLAVGLGGVAVDALLKQAIKKAFVNPSDSLLSGKIAQHLADAPTVDSTGATLFKTAQSQVAKGVTEPAAWTQTDAFKHFTPAERVSAMKFADYSKRWFSTLKSLVSRPEPMKVPAGQKAPVKVYNTAENESQKDTSNV